MNLESPTPNDILLDPDATVTAKELDRSELDDMCRDPESFIRSTTVTEPVTNSDPVTSTADPDANTRLLLSPF